MNHDIRWIGLMLVVIAMGAAMTRTSPILGFLQIILGAASAAYHLKRPAPEGAIRRSVMQHIEEDIRDAGQALSP